MRYQSLTRYVSKYWRVIHTVVTFIALYAAPGWEKALDIEISKRKLGRLHCLSALRVGSAFRTVSDEVAFVIAGTISVDISTGEMSRLFRRRWIEPSVRQEAVKKWEWKSRTDNGSNVGSGSKRDFLA